MDQINIGKFIASCRKEQGMTQAVLAEKLGISDRAISKWEIGKSMPDSGIMLELCELLKINVNELLSAERIMAEAYLDRVSCRHFRTGHGVCGFIYRDAGLAANCTYRVCSHNDFTVAFIAVGIEQKAGYYECQNCHHRYVPTYWQKRRIGDIRSQSLPSRISGI